MISIISPVYNSEKCLDQLVKKITYYVKKITHKFEVILVEDGSSDKSWDKIKKLKKKYPFIKGIKLSKNYGQHHAIYQGIRSSKKGLVIVMDCDLQDNPAYMIDMFKMYRKKRCPIIIQHSYKNFKFKDRLISNIFWIFLSLISLKKFTPNPGNYLLIDHKVKKKYLNIREIGYLYGDLILQGNNFSHIKKIRSYGMRNGSTYNLKKLIFFAYSLIIKYNFFTVNFNFLKNQKKIKILVDSKT